MSDKLIKQVSILDIKKNKDDSGEITAVISDSSLDRDSEVLLVEGANIKDFMKNPVVLFNHNPDEVIGAASSIRRSGDSLIAKFKLAEGIQRIDDIIKLVEQGFLKGISVGFQILEQRVPTEKDKKRFGKTVRNVISKFKLLEFSIVAIGANQNALITAMKSLDIDPKSILGEDYIEEEIVEQEETTDEIIEKEIEIIEKEEKIEIKEEKKEEIKKIVKEKKIDMKLVMKYFKEEIKKEIKKSKGLLF